MRPSSIRISLGAVLALGLLAGCGDGGTMVPGSMDGQSAMQIFQQGEQRALFERPEAWRKVSCSDRIAARLPGHGVTSDDLIAVA